MHSRRDVSQRPCGKHLRGGLALWFGGAVLAALTAQEIRAADSSDFEQRVRPIIEDRCYKCHGPEKQKGGLRLDSKESALKKGDSGEPALIPGDAAKSQLIKRVSTTNSEERMPPKGDPLSSAQIATLREWIDRGAVWPANGPVVATAKTELTVTEEDRKHWSFRPQQTVVPPKIQAAARWRRNSIDDFIVARLESRGIRPNPEADRRTLVRRVYFDLIGLPPTPDEVEAFVRNKSPGAYEALVDRLLADPRFGERWGRHWLDAARYADSAGFEEDRPRPNAFHYRDFVIRAFNADLPYDQFVQQQLAGDLLAPEEANVFAATGFLTASPDVRPDFVNFRKKDRYDELDDVASTIGVSMLGLTVGCARCHDHKFDPIPTRDYYRLLAFFNPVERKERPLSSAEGEAYDREMKAFDARLKAVREPLDSWLKARKQPLRLAKLEALPATDEEKAILRAEQEDGNARQKELQERFKDQLKVDDDTLRKTLSPEALGDWEKLKAGIKSVEDSRPKDIPRALAAHQGPPKTSFLLPRGDSDHEVEAVTPGMLRVLTSGNGGDAVAADASTNGLSRVDLARWLTDVRHGAGALSARVIMNRLWQHHFGRGLVATPGDFGVRGAEPTHPELLEWLAAELARGGWHLKPLHKMILMSATYRQSTAWDEARAKADSENQLWWRRRPNRIEAEALRDSILFVSGSLNTNRFGPAVKPPIHPDAIAAVTDNYDRWPSNAKDGPETWRRSIYVFAKRSNLFPFLQTFDAPNTIGSCARRNPTTVAPQALTLLNDEFTRNQARLFARRVVWEAPGSSVEDRVTHAWKLALGRAPTPGEIHKAARFLEEQQHQHETDSAQPLVSSTSAGVEALTDFCQALIASDEFCYID